MSPEGIIMPYDPSSPVTTEPEAQNLFDLLGGINGCQKLSTAFYANVEHDTVLRPLYPRHLKCAMDALALFFAQLLGGPSEYARPTWSLSLREAHARFSIGERERGAWLQNMKKALEEMHLEESTRSALYQFFQHASTYLINHPDAQKEPEPTGRPLHQELAQRWEAHLILEEAVDAVRKDNAGRALELVENSPLQPHLQRDRTAYLSLLAVMARSSSPAILDYVRRKLTEEPCLAKERYTFGHTLLHDAAAGGNVGIVELLLQFGADTNAADRFGHTPLYSVSNECAAVSGGEVVRLLAQAGANVDIQDKVKRCAALHMAARRGNVGVAAALLDCGANIEVRDSLGETPLRRAVNCSKVEVAALLLSRGANAHSVGSKGLTSVQAARGAAMKQLF
jgi:truncated hemoglobin YjbI